MAGASPETRLYLDDPYRLEFQARVVERRQLPDGGVGLVLDRTCFYPTSGGQPHDTGRIDEVAVFDVREDQDGRVVHHVQRAPVGDDVNAVVDAARRRDHMQQHSGQHLLSATCVALLERETLSFHLGAERCSIDLPGVPLSHEELERVEKRANEVVWEGRAVHTRTLGPGELDSLRKPPPVGVKSVRVVEIDSWDMSPCCGTHVRSTSEIGVIKLFAQERVRDATRLHFLCGHRAMQELARCVQRQDEIVRGLTCHPDEIVERLRRIQEEARASRKEAGALRAEVARRRAEAWVAAAPHVAGHAVVVRALDAADAPLLGDIGAAIRAAGAVAVLGARGERVALLFTTDNASGLDLRPAMQAACRVVDGRGGGSAARVAGTGTRSEALETALEAARRVLLAQLGESRF